MTAKFDSVSSEQCLHNKGHCVEVEVAYLEDTARYSAGIKIRCSDCGQPFRFQGLPLGLNLNGAAMSVDGLEARLAIMPADRIPHPLQGVTGFGVKAS